jgi:iron complex outermembrane receptor protein
MRRIGVDQGDKVDNDISRTMTLKSLLKSSAAIGVLGLPAPLYAQVAPADVRLSEVVVTGSRVKAPGLTSTSPLLLVSAQEFALQGNTNVETLLNRLPQVSGSNIDGQSTFGTPGIATVNLRDLGPQRTEVLIDGRRLMPGDPIQPFADINFIPSAMVSSVEVLTGGASTAYGSDAVAGVVNFKLNRRLEGVMIDYQFSGDQHDNGDATAQSELKAAGIVVPGDKFDGLTHSVTLAAGIDTPDKRGNVTGYFGYRSTDPISESDRDFSACGVGTISGALPYNTHACVGSGTSAFGRIGGEGTGVSDNPDGSATFVPYTTALNYNSNQETDLQRADARYTAGLFADYALTRKATVYGEFMFMDDQTRAFL